jgi:ABC-type Fe3+/spermidine/putrescine transport system ATPase subunit
VRPAPALTVLRLDGVRKLFGGLPAVDGVSLEIARGEIFTLLGPSGCGKTTTLRLVAGLERPDAGEITLRDRLVASVPRRAFVPPHRRNLGMVFQSYAIWPHMTVFENVAYPLELRGVRRGVVLERVAAILELVGLAGLESRAATLLSGGQMQRLALCRALVYEPDLLLLDEPFSNLDAKLREQMRVELKLLQRRLGITVLFVTHDQIEALSLSDRIAVMQRGRVEQVGAPRELYERPASAFVRDFLGQTVILRGVVEGLDAASGIVTVAMDGPLAGSTLRGRAAPDAALAAGAPAHIAIRPEDIEVAITGAAPPEDTGAPALGGTIEALLFVGDRYEARVALGGEQRVLLLLSRARAWREGQRLALVFPPDLVSVWPA